MSTLRHWILSIVATSILCGAVKALTPPGLVRRAVSAVCGFAVLAAVLGILGDVDALGISRYTARYNEEAQARVDLAQDAGSTQTRFIIEDRCEAYILDKAARLDLPLSSVRVTAKWSEEGFWYPVSAALGCPEDPRLSKILESDLGILSENQTWSAENES